MVSDGCCGKPWWFASAYAERGNDNVDDMVEDLGKDVDMKKNLVSNCVGTYLSGWDISIAIQRAKERKNPSPDVKVMVKTVNQPRLKLGGAVVPLGWAVVPLLERPGVPVLAGRSIGLWGSGCTASVAGCTAFVGKIHRSGYGVNFGAEMDDFGGKIAEISRMESGETCGEARSTQGKANPRIKINKTS